MSRTAVAKPTRRAKPIREREGAPPRTAYTLPEVAASLGLSVRQVQRLAQPGGGLPSKLIGGRRLVLVDDLQTFLEAS